MKYLKEFDDLVHEEMFGKPFAKKGRYKVGFGKSSKSADNPVDIQWEFQTGDEIVNEVSYLSGSHVTNGGFVLIISDHPDAELDDVGIVGSVQVENGKPAPRLSMFVNDVDIDPQPPVIRDGSQPEPYVQPRTTWLQTNSVYYGRLYRTDLREDGVHPPQFLETMAS